MTNELVSIIIPVYNGEQYIEDTIASIRNQAVSDYKIYIINDGSTDNTAAILENYQGDDDIELIYQENAGVSSARNRGLSLVKGKYLAFVDADDKVLPGFLEVLLEPFEDEQVALTASSYKVVDLIKHETRTVRFDSAKLEKDEAIEYLISEKGPQGYLWNKLFLVDRVRKLNLTFHSDIFMAEDLLFVIEYLQMGGLTAISTEPVYEYLVYSGSSNKMRLETLKDGYDRYFDNFLVCMDRILASFGDNQPLSYQAALGRKGKLAVNYLRANQLMGNSNKELKQKLLNLARENRKYYFKGIDANIKSCAIYMMTLLVPSLVLKRDKKHFKYTN